MLSHTLQHTLHRALLAASERQHEYATLEHLLLALVDDADAVLVLRGSGVDLDRLRSEVTKFLDKDLAGLATGRAGDPQPTAGFQRVLQRAAIHVQSSGRDEATGANVLVALFSERESHAVYFLQSQDMTRLDAVNFMSHGIAKGTRPGIKPAENVRDAVLAGIDQPALARGLDALRTAIALIRETEGALPTGDKREVIAAALTVADRQMKIAEAQIALGFGYALCQCAFPPTPMLMVGEYASPTGERALVRECPRCKRHDGPRNDSEWIRHVPPEGRM